jgi:D-hydroxyproline dehydrogenase subunit gamma
MDDRNVRLNSFVNLSVNGRVLSVPEGASVAAALLSSDAHCRISESGELRYPLCGMGICFECRAIIDGLPHRRTCQIACRGGMIVESQR